MLTKEQKGKIDDYALDVDVPAERLTTYKHDINPYECEWDEDEEESRQYEMTEEFLENDPVDFLYSVLGIDIDDISDEEFENIKKDCQDYIEDHMTWDMFDDF